MGQKSYPIADFNRRGLSGCCQHCNRVDFAVCVLYSSDDSAKAQSASELLGFGHINSCPPELNQSRASCLITRLRTAF
ncbi:MAG: hypothetical protein ACJAQ6_002451 [Arenicella sp.]|jgi:hypothetical protein